MRLLPRLLVLSGLLLAAGGPARAQDSLGRGDAEPDSAALPDSLAAPDSIAPPVEQDDVQEEQVAEDVEARPRVEMQVEVEGDGGRVTTLGKMVIELYPEDAPLHVANFLERVDAGEYEGLAFHRIVPGFIIQGGDPASRANWRSPRLGYGGSDCTLPAEVHRPNTRGAVAAARKPDEVNPQHETSCYQFYICLADLPGLDRGNHTVFGQVVEGMEVVEKVARVKNAGSSNMNRALQRVYMIDVRRVP